MNRAIDWLKKGKIKRVIVTSDFHLSTQMVGADTSEFFPALLDTKKGEAIAAGWSKTARRLHDEFEISVGFVNGKRCMGGMLELMMHCHYLITDENTDISMPEVTLPVIPGMEGCHWAIRKAGEKDRSRLVKMLLEGKRTKAKDTKGWLVDYAGPMEDAIQKAWEIMQNGTSALPLRKVETRPLGISTAKVKLPKATDPAVKDARRAISDCIEASCNTTLAKAISVQAKHSAEFMVTKTCRRGSVGQAFDKIMSS